MERCNGCCVALNPLITSAFNFSIQHFFPVRVLLATDSFPPRCGGSGWSTYELARGLRALGHDVIVVQPKPGERQGQRERQYEGIRTIEHGFPAPSIPYVRNYFKNERLYPALGEVLARNAPLSTATEAEFASWIAARAGVFPDAYRRIKAVNVGLEVVDDAEAEALEAGRNQCALG